jgi:lysyl-tRNA synthetase, class II
MMRNRLRSLRQPPVLLAFGAALVGAVNVVSALTPELADRLDLVRAMLPTGTPEVAGAVTFAAGVVLLWLSASLARRKHRAWLLAVALVIVSAVAHLAKGLDVEESLGSLMLLAGLFRSRGWFDSPGDPETLRPVPGAIAGLLGCLAGWAVAHGVAERGFTLLLYAVGGYLLYLWLRAWREPVVQDPADRERARQLVSAHGRDSLSFFSLRRDKCYHFSPGRGAFLAYRVVAGCALVSGDPIGDKAEFPALIESFSQLARDRGWRLVVLHASAELLPLYRRRGLHAVPIGDEAVIRTADFSLEGRAIRKVRQSVTRLHREGYTAVVVAPGELTASMRRDIDRVSRTWLGRWCDRGFSMAMDDMYAHDEARFVLAVAPGGRVTGFLHLVPSTRGCSLSAMRRMSDTPNGLMEFLICQAVAWTGDEGGEELSLNFSVFADVLRADAESSRLLRATRWAVLRLDRAFQLERLFRFNRKFSPEWRTRYICFERAIDVPVLSLATLRVEQLLVPPRLRRAA